MSSSASSAPTAYPRPTAGSRPRPRTSACYLRDGAGGVVVYCQVPGDGPDRHDEWHGIERVIIPDPPRGLAWHRVLRLRVDPARDAPHATRRRLPHLRLQHRRLQHRPAPARHPQRHQHGRDGVDPAALGTRQAGHPARQRAVRLPGRRRPHRRPPRHRDLPPAALRPRRVATITYGAHAVDRRARPGPSRPSGWHPGGYATMVCRPIPENSILEIVTRLVRRDRAGSPLVVLGHYDATTTYHARVLAAASDEVVFPGAIYDPRGRAVAAVHTRALPPRPHRRRHQPLAGRGDGGRQRRHRPRQRLQPWVAGPEQRATSPTPPISTPASTTCSTTPSRRDRMGGASRGALRATSSPGSTSAASTSRRCTRAHGLVADDATQRKELA